MLHKILTLLACVSLLRADDSLFVEAEAFADHGGWSTDTQFILNMGSAYLLAHGLGDPVKEATTRVKFPSTGTYHVFARTMDWVARWEATGAPGKFQLLIDGKPTSTTFGTEGKDWHWQAGGKIEIESAEVTLSLRDLTGFDGRCDALYFTKAEDDLPPNDSQALFNFRREKLNLPATPPTEGPYDLVVVGGGYSGLGAALSASRQGLKVALIHDRPVLGGNGSSEVRVWAKGGTQRGKFPHLGEIIEEFADFSRDSPGVESDFVDDLKLEVVKAEPTLDLYLEHFAFRTNTKNNKIVSVDAVDTTSGIFKRIAGKLFCDTTGHGSIGAQAGAEYMMATEGHMGMSNMWAWQPADDEVPWPKTPWALPLGKGDFPALQVSKGPYEKFYKAEWFWEGGFDKHPIKDLEPIRDWNLRANFGAFSHIRSSNPKAKLKWMAFIGGNRESRRLEGDIVLTGEDIVARKDFPDGCVPTTWSIDLHYPREEFEKGAAKENPFISRAEFGRHVDRKNGYPIPYRCFYSKNIENLFMAGRCISVDRQALGTIRVMRTCGMMGEVVGKAAWIASTQETTPRGVYQNYLPVLIDLMEKPGRARRSAPGAKLEVPPIPPEGLRSTPPSAEGLKLKGIVIDDPRAKVTGNWTNGSNLKPFVGSGYQYAAAPATAKFTIRVKRSGKYEIRYYWQNHENRTSEVAVKVDDGRGVEVSSSINQKSKPGEGNFTSLGTFELSDVLPATVEFEHTKDGLFHLDAIQAVEVKPSE